MFLTGPRIVKRALGEEVSTDGARRHRSAHAQRRLRLRRPRRRRRGQSCCASCSATCRRTAASVPASTRRRAARRGRSGGRAAAERSRNYYDVRELIATARRRRALPGGSERWARNMVVGFARLEGQAVAIVANQAALPRRHHRRDGVAEGQQVHPHLRRLRHPAARARRHARLHARQPRGGGGRDQATARNSCVRSPAPAPARDGDRAQGLRRRLHHDELEGPRRRRLVLLAAARRSGS